MTLILTAALVATQLSVTVLAREAAPGDGSVVSVDGPGESTAEPKVSGGTEISGPNLTDTLQGEGEHVMKGEAPAEGESGEKESIVSGEVSGSPEESASESSVQDSTDESTGETATEAATESREEGTKEGTAGSTEEGMTEAEAEITEESTEEPAPECRCVTLCTVDAVDSGCPVCGREDADLSECRGKSSFLTGMGRQGSELSIPYEVSNLSDIGRVETGLQAGDTVIFKNWDETTPVTMDGNYYADVNLVFETYRNNKFISLPLNLGSVRITGNWSIYTQHGTRVNEVLVEAGAFLAYTQCTIGKVEMTGGFFNQTAGEVTGDFLYHAGKIAKQGVILGDGGTFQNLSGSPVTGKINGTEMTVQPGETVSREGHPVTVSPASNGSASVSSGHALPGQTVTLTANPDSGYRLKEWKVIPDSVTVDADNRFTMPDESVTVEPVFETIIRDIRWDGQSDTTAQSLGAVPGDTITITGSCADIKGAALTIDVGDITVTSNGSVSGVCVRVASDTLTVKDLNLTAQDEKFAIYFQSDGILTVEGRCAVTGGVSGSRQSLSAISGQGSLTLKVGTASLTAVGGATTAAYSGGHGIFGNAGLTVDVADGGILMARGGDSAGEGKGGAGLVGYPVTVNNSGEVLAESGRHGRNMGFSAGISSTGDTALYGSGRIAVKGGTGIRVLDGELKINGTVEAEGTETGLLMSSSAAVLSGAGSLTARATGEAGVGIYVSKSLDLAFTGRLTVQGGASGHGILSNFGDLIISRTPVFLDIRAGAADGHSIHIENVNVTNLTDIPVTVNSREPVGWPVYPVAYTVAEKDGGEVPAAVSYCPGTNVKAAGNTGGLTRKGFTFSGWKNSMDGNIYTEGQTFSMPAAPVTLSAQWTDIPAAIVGVSPSGDGAAVDGNLVITFDKAMNTAAGSVSLTGGGSTQPLANGSWNSPANTQYTAAYSGLMHDTGYVIGISGFKDAAGNPVADNSSHTFTTALAGQAVMPVANPPGGAYDAAQSVTLTCATPGASIYYTLDGSDPVTGHTGQLYTGPVSVQPGSTLKAYAKAAGWADSAVLTEVYTRKSIDSHDGGGEMQDIGAPHEETAPETGGQPENSYALKGNEIHLSLARSVLQRLAAAGKTVTIACDKVRILLKPAALQAILAVAPASAEAILLQAVPADLTALPDAAALTGGRPACDFTISYRDGAGIHAMGTVNFPAGSAVIGLRYDPAAGESTGSLFMVYAGEAGGIVWLSRSVYANGWMLAEVPHFSIYGVDAKVPAPGFSDTAGHWAKEDIAFAVSRGLLAGEETVSGTGSLFFPDGAITRGALVTALGRLAGVDPASCATRSFTDITAEDPCAPYAEWAVQNNIITEKGNGAFGPDDPVTREELAVILYRYAGQTGSSLLAACKEAAFTDSASVSPWAAKEAAALQQAGILRGRDNNTFAPQENATRAEAAAALHRLVKGYVIQ